jgi:hypothetical protein
MTRNASKMTTIEEHEVGSEDRVFLSDDGWYWQARGTSDAWGPFSTRDEAVADYAAAGAKELPNYSADYPDLDGNW